MRHSLFVICFILSADILFAQNIGIGTTAPAEKLEIKNALRSTVKISSNSYTDTSQLIFSNRDNTAAGTDFLITSKQEQGLFFTSKSDFGSNTNDSSLVIRPNGNIGIGVKAPTAKLHVNGSAVITGFNALEFGGGVTKEINSGKIGYQTFTVDALDIVGAGVTSGNRKIKFWNEGGATFAGPINLNNTLQVNNNTGTQGQVLTSNGTAAPSWENSAFTNTTRFSAKGVQGANYYNSLNFSTIYNTNPADVTITGSAITINKAGLYHLEGNMTTFATYFPSADFAPSFNLYINVGSISQYAELISDALYNNQFVSGGKAYLLNRPFVMEDYFAAGTIISFDPFISPSSAATSFSFTYALNLRGHLISQ